MHPAERIRLGATNGSLSGKRLLVCVTGSIAAVETVKLVRSLLRMGAEVTVSMTEAATRIIHPEALWFASGKEVITRLDGDVRHVTMCGSGEGSVDAVLVTPCTANMISKLASGICDDAVSTMLVTALGAGKPIALAPSMHGDMWGNRIIQENMEKLSSLGVSIVPPVMDEGKAKMADTDSIILYAGRSVLGTPLRGKKITIIGGATAEPIDEVRSITNKSTGGTAVALAKESYMLGADVELLMGDCNVRLPGVIPITRFGTVRDLKKTVSGRKFGIVLVPAAISDFSPDRTVKGKISSDKESVSIVLKRTDKIIDEIEADTLIGFKLEVGASVEELKERARERMIASSMAAIVANRLEDVTDETSRAFLIDRSGRETEFFGTREEIARGIVAHIAKGLI